jgi:hypothetical protein
MNFSIHESKCGKSRLREAQFWATKIVAEHSRYRR